MPLVRREDSVFVVVDAQPGFFDYEALGADDASGPPRRVARIAWMAGLAALLDVPAVVVEEAPRAQRPHRPGDPRARPGRDAGDRPSRRSASPRTRRPSTRSARPDGGTIVLVGFETDVCVAQSAIGLLELGFRAVVLEDATYTNSAREHERGLARMTGAGVERNHCKGLTFEWLHTVDRALEDFPAASALGTPPWRL